MHDQMNSSGDHDHSHQCHGGSHCRCTCIHHPVTPVAIALIGVFFLLQAWGIVSAETNAIIWPILLIIAAGTKVFGRMCKCC